LPARTLEEPGRCLQHMTSAKAVDRTPAGVPLARQRDHATVWLANEHTETGVMAGLWPTDI
jgi:hypothetical protein